MYGRKDIVLFLLKECHLDVNAPGEQGWTALHLAVKFNYAELAELLLQAGARVDALTRDEKNARDLARHNQDCSYLQMGEMLDLIERYDPGGGQPKGSTLPRVTVDDEKAPAGTCRRTGAYHDPMAASQNAGNLMGDMPSVRQTPLSRRHVSGNATKEVLGQTSLMWNEGDGPATFMHQREGTAERPAKKGSARGWDSQTRYGDAVGKGRRGPEMESPWVTSSSSYGAGQ
jgi:ankyrin repeat protein